LVSIATAKMTVHVKRDSPVLAKIFAYFSAQMAIGGQRENFRNCGNCQFCHFCHFCHLFQIFRQTGKFASTRDSRKALDFADVLKKTPIHHMFTMTCCYYRIKWNNTSTKRTKMNYFSCSDIESLVQAGAWYQLMGWLSTEH
jgi:hypothetical protein